MPRPRLLLILPTTTYKASAFMDAASRLDVEVTVASEERSVLETPQPAHLLALDFADTKRAVQAALAFHGEHPLAGVVAADDACVVVGAAIAGALGFPCNSVEAVRASTNKREMRERFAGEDVGQPAYHLASLDDDPQQLAETATYPCVLKPTTRFASQGVIRANDASEFVAAFHRIDSLMQRPEIRDTAAASRDLLIEQYIPGAEVAFEGLLAHGELLALALFDKPDPLEGPFFEETIYVTPSRLDAAQQQEITACVSGACAGLGLREGPIHAELRLSTSGPVLIEVAARTIGGQCGRALRFGADVSLEELVIRHALGLPVDSYDREAAAAGVMMIPTPMAGHLERVEGIAAAAAVPGVEDVSISARPGDIVEPAPEGSKYLGFIFARGTTPEEVESALHAAHAHLQIHIRPMRG